MWHRDIIDKGLGLQCEAKDTPRMSTFPIITLKVIELFGPICYYSLILTITESSPAQWP